MLSTIIVMSLLSATPVDLVDVASCKQNKRPDPERIAKLLDIEREAGVPNLVRGILVAASCRESGYKAVLAGDGGRAEGILQFWGWSRPHIREIRKQLCNELQPSERVDSIHCKWLDDPRQDWFASATYWAQRLVEMYGRAKRLCTRQRGYESMEMMWWASANLTVGWAPRCHQRGRCLEWNDDRTCNRYGCARWGVHCARKGSKRMETKHIKLWRRWQGEISERTAQNH